MNLRLLVFLGFLILLPQPFHGAAAAEPAVLKHELSVRIRPLTHELEVVDQIRNLPGGTMAFSLAPTLTVRSVVAESGEIPFEPQETGFSVKLPEGPTSLTVSYAGQIYDPVRKSKTLTFVRGDDTAGVVSPEGVFLTPSSGWIPEIHIRHLAQYRLSLTLHDGLFAVTQGTLVDRNVSGETETTVWVAGIPSDGLVLVAGKYEIVSRQVEGITYAAYLSADNRQIGDLLIDASIRYISLYASLLGPYPHARWAVVENFFSSGYGMPGFTLLDPRVLAQGRRLLKPGYLDHEIVHSWFGNFVLPDYEKGNWAEGITTYLTNYYYYELQQSPEEAQRHRIQTVERFTVMVDPERDYPIRSFTSKREEYESNIGYGKSSMVFHMLRREVGDTSFFKGVKEFVRKFGGRRASWNDLRRVFEEEAGWPLRSFFRQWIDRQGGPEFSLGNASAERNAEGNYLVHGQVRQRQNPYTVELPIVVMTDEGLVRHRVPVRQEITSLALAVTGRPLWMAIDPEYHLFRIVPETDLHPNLNRVLESGTQSYLELVDTPDGQVDLLIQRLKEQKGGWAIEPDVLIDALGMGSVFMVGRPDLVGLPNLVSEHLRFLPGRFVFNGTEYAAADHAILFSMDNPYSPGSVVTVYAGNSTDALRRAAYLPYYRNDTYVIFQDGRPVNRGYLPYLGPRTSRQFQR